MTSEKLRFNPVAVKEISQAENINYEDTKDGQLDEKQFGTSIVKFKNILRSYKNTGQAIIIFQVSYTLE